MDKGWIKLHKQFLDWEWFTDVNTCHLFLYCLVRANYKDTKWNGIVLKRGSFITSYKSLSEATGLSIRNIRTSLKKLTSKTTSELTHKTTNHYSIITIKNYNKYQITDKQNDKQADNPLTTDKEIKKSNISYINSSSSSSITEEEEELLKSHSKRNNIKYFRAWLRKVLANGDYKEILEKERKRLKLLEEKQEEVAPVEVIMTDEEREKVLKESRKFLEERGIKICKRK